MRLVIMKTGGILSFTETIVDAEISDRPATSKEALSRIVSDLRAHQGVSASPRTDGTVYSVWAGAEAFRIEEQNLPADVLDALDAVRAQETSSQASPSRPTS